MIKIKTRKGDVTSLRIDAVKVGRVYAGLFEGIPSSAENDERIDHLKIKARQEVGFGPFSFATKKNGEKVYNKKAHPVVVQPKRRKPDLSLLSGSSAARHLPDNPEWLPEYYLFAMLDGNPTDGKSCGGCALLILFVDALDKSLIQLLEEALKEEIWEYIAYNYVY